MEVAAGTIYLKGGRRIPGSVLYAPGTDNLDHVRRLDTHQTSSEGTGAPDPTGGHPMCMNCFLHHPEGECDH